MFACAHPAIDAGIRAPLILQTVLGFDAATIASAFLVAPATMGQRLVRAKQKIATAGIPFRVPERAELRGAARCWKRSTPRSPKAGSTRATPTRAAAISRTRRSGSGDSSRRCCRDEPEALGLLALMLHVEARRAARRTAAGDYVPLAEQDPAAWDAGMIDEAEELRPARERVAARSDAISSRPPSSRRTPSGVLTGRSDWAAIERLYDALVALTASPVVGDQPCRRRRRASRSGRRPRGARRARCRRAPRDYQPYWAARAGLLAATGDADAADHAYACAIGLERDPAVRAFLEERRAAARLR